MKFASPREYRVIKTVSVILVALFLFGYFWHLSAERDSLSVEFANGSVPSRIPDGFMNIAGPWWYPKSIKGFMFDSDAREGWFVYEDSSGAVKESEKYKIVQDELRNKRLFVKYCPPDVPRLFVWEDEIVKLKDGSYSGRLKMEIVPGLEMTLRYLRLSK